MSPRREVLLVGVQSARLPNVKSYIADVSPDAERVQTATESCILQSRNIAKQVIDQLRLRDDPGSSIPAYASRHSGRFNPRQYLPPMVLVPGSPS